MTPSHAILLLAVLSSCTKFLLYPAYHSTDFEVHRNWLAITSSVPLKEWYTEATSEWTLDYPPFFAWFEHFLSWFAPWFDEDMLDVANLDYNSTETVVFQRLTVIAADMVLLHYLFRFFTANHTHYDSHIWLRVTLVFLHPALLLVDHVHFQYNGLLFGLLVFFICLAQEKRYALAGTVFAILLNFKHIFLYMLPAVFTWLFTQYCGGIFSFKLSNFITLGTCVVMVFAASLSPWFVYGRLNQLLSRLFPFGRGLCHAYWAPNFWALYNVIDYVVCKLFFNHRESITCRPLMSKGLVGTSGTVVEHSHAVLFQITPLVSILLVVMSLSGLLYNMAKNKTGIIMGVVLSAYSFFLFGWHVHEKATLMFAVPMGLLMFHRKTALLYWQLMVVSTFSVLPLLFRPQELLLKWSVLGGMAHASWVSLQYISHPVGLQPRKTQSFNPLTMDLLGTFLLALCLGAEIFASVIHPSSEFLHTKYPFVGLLLISTTNSLTILYFWFKLCVEAGLSKFCFYFLSVISALCVVEIGFMYLTA